MPVLILTEYFVNVVDQIFSKDFIKIQNLRGEKRVIRWVKMISTFYYMYEPKQENDQRALVIRGSLSSFPETK